MENPKHNPSDIKENPSRIQFLRMMEIAEERASRTPSSAQKKVRDSSAEIINKTDPTIDSPLPAQDTPKTDSENTPESQTPLNKLQQCGTIEGLKKFLDKYDVTIEVSTNDTSEYKPISPEVLIAYLSIKKSNFFEYDPTPFGITIRQAHKDRMNAAIRETTESWIKKGMLLLNPAVNFDGKFVTITIKLAETK